MDILNMLHNLRFFSSSKCRLFHNSTFFGSCIIHILNTGVLKFKRKFRRQRVKNINELKGQQQFKRTWNIMFCERLLFCDVYSCRFVLIYGVETWSLYEDDRRRINANEMDALIF